MMRKTIACRLAQKPEQTPGRTPRVARLMALALHFQDLIDTGVVGDYAHLARLGHVSRSRVSHIMSLLHLAPDLQETILFLPPTRRGRDPIALVDLLAVARLPKWTAITLAMNSFIGACAKRAARAISSFSDRPTRIVNVTERLGFSGLRFLT